MLCYHYVTHVARVECYPTCHTFPVFVCIFILPETGSFYRQLLKLILSHFSVSMDQGGRLILPTLICDTALLCCV